MTDCGACQQCIITYKIEQGAAFQNAEAFQSVMRQVLNLCANSSVSDQIVALQAQASRLAVIADNAIATAAAAANNTASTTMPASTASASEGSSADDATEPLNKTWIIGPVIGSVLGISTIFIVIYFTKRRQAQQFPSIYLPDIKAEDTDSEDSPQLSAALPAEREPPRELENNEVYELAAAEPVGNELNTPMQNMGKKDWPLPMTPLRTIFAMTELRDEREAKESQKHQTYYNP